jgi:hypothetical protein
LGSDAEVIKLEGNLHSQLKQTPFLPSTLSLTTLSEATKKGLGEAKNYWVEKVVKDKFGNYAAAKYKFFPRSPKYQRQKMRSEWMFDRFLKIKRPIVKPVQSLVLFGDLKKELMARTPEGYNSRLVATDRKTEMTIRVRSPHAMRHNQWLELKETLPSQTRNMVEMVKKEFTAGLQQLMAA